MSEEKKDPLDVSIRSLIKSAYKVHDELYGKMAQQKLWVIWISKFNAAYEKTKNPAGFKKMFLDFFNDNVKSIAVPIYNESGGVNVKWLKSEEFLPAPGMKEEKKGKAKESEWSPGDARCRGPVIYFNKNEAKTRAVSIPIGEIYQSAVKLYIQRHEKDASIGALPPRILMYFYSIVSAVLPADSPHCALIKKNVQKLQEAIDQVSSDKPEEGGSGAAGVGRIIGQVIGAVSPGTKVNESQIEQGIDKILKGGTIEKFGKVATEITKSFNEEEKAGDVGSIISKLGQALQKDDIRGAIADSVTEVGSAVSGKSIKPVEHGESDPSEQE